jgi:hypothetical protein
LLLFYINKVLSPFIWKMVNFSKFYTVSLVRAKEENGVPAFDKQSHRPKYEDIIPDEIVRRIRLSPLAQEAVSHILGKWEKVKWDPNAFTAFLNDMKVSTNIIGALKAWSSHESKMPFIEFLLQPSYHHHFSAILGKEGILALNMEIDLRGYLHEVGVLCRLLKAYRIGSQHQGSDVDLLCHVNQIGEQLDPENQEKLEEENGTNLVLDITLYTLSLVGKTVVWASKGHPLVVQFLLSCNGVMPPLTPEQLQELLQVRIKGFWALFCQWDLNPELIQLGKREEEAKASLARAQDGTLTRDDMVALVEAFRQRHVAIPTKKKILDKWLKALNSLLKQYLHITALVNGIYTAKKEDLIEHSGITGNALDFLKYVLYHGNQGAITQQCVTDLLHLLLNDASLFTPGLTLQQGPMWMVRLTNYKDRMSMSKGTTTVQGQGQVQPPVLMTADVLNLLLTKQPSHPVVQWFLAQIRAVKEKRDRKVLLSSFEASLMRVVTNIGPETTDATLVSMSSKDLSKLVPKDKEILNSMPLISREEYERISGMLMTLDGMTALCIDYGDKTSLDNDKCLLFGITSENADTYIVKTSSGIYALRNLSSAITQGGDVSTLILQEKDGKLFPAEIMNFYLNDKGEKVYVKEDKGKVVHLNGTPVPPTATLQYEYDLVPATSPPLLERYAILCTTGIMDEKFRERLSLEPLVYKILTNYGKWLDLIRYIIRWGTDTLTELSVLLHMLRTINAPQSLIARIEAMKKTRDELFEAMKQPNAINQEFMQKWVSMLHEMFALKLHTPDVLAFMQRHRDIKGLTEEQTQKIQRYLKMMYMSRLSFFKAIVFRLCQIMYGLFVCIPEKKYMIYVKAELAEKVLPVLHQKGILIPIDTLVALLHRNFSLPNDIRLSSSMHLDFEKFVLGALAVLVSHFTGQELRQMEKGEPVSWLTVACIPEPTPEAHTAEAPAPAPAPEAHTAPEPAPEAHTAEAPASAPIPVEEAQTLESLQQFVKEAKNRSPGKPWSVIISLFAKSYNGGQLGDMLIEIAGCNDILKAIAIVAKKVCENSQPQRIQPHRIEALIVLLLNNFFGYGQEAFIASIKAEKGAYNPTDDIKELPGRIAELHKSLQAPIPAPAQTHAQTHAQTPVCVSLWEKYRKVIYDMIKVFKRGLDIMSVFDNKKTVVVVVQNEGVFHVSPLSEGTLCVMSYTHPALSGELMSLMTHRFTTSNFQILGTVIPPKSSVPLTMTKKQLSCQELHAETVAHLTSIGVSFLSILRFGSSLHCTDETRPMDRDVDFRVLIPEGEHKGIVFIASDGTPCDLSFTTLEQATKQHEVLIAMLLGSSWMDASGCIVEPFEMPPTLNQCLHMLLPVVGITIHYNSIKGKGNHDPVKTFQSVRLMVALMKMVIEHQQYPRYDPHAFFPEEFNKDAFVQFLTSPKVDYVMVVDLFTKAQYCITKGELKAQEPKYKSTMDALPDSLKQLMLKFKEVTTTTFLNPGVKKDVSGVRTVLERISKQ